MKVAKRSRKRSAVLAVGAAIAPLTGNAAALGTNLTVNPGFENVDLTVTSAYYNAPLILDWSGSVSGFAYSHDLSGMSVPNYANGTLASGGHWYFTPGNNGNNSLANALIQTIDVSTGPSGPVIATGNATFALSAFFSTFSTQPDRGFVRADFLGPADINLGNALISSPVSPALTDWTFFSTSGVVPVGTQTVQLSSWGETSIAGSPDGYTDNISFVIVPEPSSTLLVGIGAGYALGIGRRRRAKT